MSPAGALRPLEARVTRKRLVNASGDRVEILGAISLRLERGQTGVLIGPSGCGKSTLLRIVAGLDTDYEGSVTRPEGPLAMVFQEPRLLPWRSVEQNIRLAAPQIAEAELVDMLAALALTDHRAHFPGELSLGLARRVAIARAFAVRPVLLPLDEPFASLDAPLARTMQRELLALAAARATTVLLVTHNADEAAQLADRIWLLSPRPARIVEEIAVVRPREAMSEAEALALKARIAARQAAS